MAEYIVNTEETSYVASVEYNITVEPVMRIELLTATFNKDKAERIVRCRDCKYYVEDPEPLDPCFPMMCDLTAKDMVKSNGFCA